MQVHVDDVEPHVPGAHLAEDRVQVGAVVVKEAAGLVHDARHLLDVPLEHPERGGVGEHDAGGLRADRGAQRLELDVAVRIHRDLAHHAAAHGRGRRIGAVRGLGHDDLVALEVPARAVIGADHGDAGEFPVRAGHGRERDALHPGHFLQHLLQLVHAGEEALAVRLGPERVARQELRQHRVLVAGLGVVLHRARAERVEVRVDGEVQLREAREVAHRLELADFRQRRRRGAAQCRGQVLERDARPLPPATGRSPRVREWNTRKSPVR